MANMKKKYVLFLSSVLFLFSCSACGEKKEQELKPEQKQETENKKDFSYQKDIALPAFEDIHSQLETDDNEYLILGNVPVSEPAKNTPGELADLIGRWEGYDLSPPVRKDTKVVFVIQEITEDYVTLKFLRATNLQYPIEYQELRANIEKTDPPAFQMASFIPDPSFKQLGIQPILRVVFNKEKNTLDGEVRTKDGQRFPFPPPFNLDALRFSVSRSKKFTIFRDYDKYLSQKSISIHEFKQEKMTGYGKGYMLYLPREYKTQKNWPLIIFLHGSGDVGNNIHLLAKASPYMYTRKKGDLPFVIAAPLLGSTAIDRSFPVEYMSDFLDMMIDKYKVDPGRIYFTGLSMGGEAALRFAAFHPEKVAAVAALSAPLNIDGSVSQFVKERWERIGNHVNGLNGLPILYVHGAEDILVTPENVEKTLQDVRNAGAVMDVRKLEDHDHDVWTDTYSDAAFYDWLLQYKKEKPQKHH